jgi:hypothetical protein
MDRMVGSAPQFPAIDVWTTMEESEQDALIARMEAAQRRKAIGARILLGLGCALAAVAVAFYLGLVV